MNKSFFILGNLSDDNVEWIAANGVHRVAVDGEVLISAGVPSANIYFLLDGEMVVTIADVGEVAKLKSVDIIGEMSFIDGSSLPAATVAATRECVLLEVPKKLIEDKIANDLDFAANFYRAIAAFLAERLRIQYVAATSKKKKG